MPVSGNYGTPGNPQDIWSEFWELQWYSGSDPAHIQGDFWGRSDLYAGNQIATIRVDHYQGSGVWDVPVYSDPVHADERGAEVRKVETPNGTGFVPITTSGGAYSNLRVQHAGQWHGIADSTAVIPPSGIGRWTLNDEETSSGNALDIWNSHDGTINGATTGVAGANQTYSTDEAYDFNGSSDYVNTSLNLGTISEVSLSVWFNADATTDFGVIAGQASLVGDGAGYSLYVEGSELHWQVTGGSTAHNVTTAVNTGQWYHALGSWDGSTLRLYVDGSLVGTASPGLGSVNPAPDFNLGRRPISDDSYFGGTVDDVRLYSKATFGGDATNLYNDGSILPTYTQVWQSSLIATGTVNDTARNQLIDGDHLYAVSSSPQVFAVYDISNPESPTQETTVGTNYWNVDIRRAGDYVFVSNEDGIDVWDISTPTSPTLDNHHSLGTFVHGTYLQNGYLYCCEHDADVFEIVDVSTPTNPTTLGSVSGSTNYHGVHDATVENGYAYLANMDTSAGQYGFVVVDVSDPSNPSLAAAPTDSDGHSNSHLIKVDDYCYVGSHDDDGITVWDVSTPTSPTYVGRFLTSYGRALGYWFEQYNDNTLATISTGSDTLVLIDISTRDSPTAKTDVSTDYNPKNVVADGDYVYVSEEDWSSTGDPGDWYLTGYELE